MMPPTKALITSNWGDHIGNPISRYLLLPIALRIPFLTPNGVTFISFGLFTIGSSLLFINIPYHLYFAAALIVAGYLGDHLDGHLARARGLMSVIGDYLDKTLDVLKLYIITASLGYAVYLQTGNALYILAAFTACFFFLFRYYIKLETMFSRMNEDRDYLTKSATKRLEILAAHEALAARAHASFKARIQVLWRINRTFFAVDEAEFALITACCAIVGRLDIALVFIAFIQVCAGFWRLYERGRQLHLHPEELLLPLRK